MPRPRRKRLNLRRKRRTHPEGDCLRGVAIAVGVVAIEIGRDYGCRRGLDGASVSTRRGSDGRVIGAMVKRRAFLVDGHSVIFSVDELQRMHRAMPRQARDQLCAWLARFMDHTGEVVVVVFDGDGGRVRSERVEGGIQVIYSQRGGAADDIIEKLAARYGDDFDLTVVTRDRGERTTVEGFGAGAMEPEMFVRVLESAESKFYDGARKYFRGEGD